MIGNIKPFDLSKMKPCSSIFIVGPRNSGKSVLIKDILSHTCNKIGAVVSPLDKFEHFYDKFIPNDLIRDEYDDSIISGLMQKQYNDTSIVLDDCLNTRNFIGRSSLANLFLWHRHYKLQPILSSQIPKLAPLMIRINFDFIFILKNNNKSDREKIFNDYTDIFSNIYQFETVLDACTEDYRCLVIDNTTRTDKIEDQIFYYKANSVDIECIDR